MGKFVKKGKITRHVSLSESPQSQSPLGLRTRAKTKTLAALHQTHELCYLQLRSRRLQKPRLPTPAKNRTVPRLRSPVCSGPGLREMEVKVDAFVAEASFGENDLEIGGIGRSTREGTPCSFTRDVGSVGTPGSASMSTCSGAVNQRRFHDPVQRSLPSTREMDQFFGNEGSEQQLFIDKYNFDIYNDLPLPGRFEWVRVDP